MAVIRRLLLLLSVILFTVCVVLLLNITAPNPTHRRYSSRSPLIGSPATSQQIGEDGERVLSADTGIVRNESEGQRQTFCKTAKNKPTENGRCIAYYAALTASFRRPDFLTDALIIESKNRAIMDEDDTDLLQQIGDYSLVALTTGRALWIYTRVDTDVADKYIQLAEATGGGLVRYFSVPGWADPVDQSTRTGLALSGSIVGTLSLWEIVKSRRRLAATRIRVQRDPPADVPPSDSVPVPSSDPNSPHPPRGSDPLGDAWDALNRAEESVKQTRRKL